MIERTSGRYADLVDVENGTISREIFVDEGIFRDELEHLFSRAWLFVGHESLDSESERLLRVAHGRGVGDPVPRPRR